ncbi:MAG: type II secretion system F family protein [Elusimicrobiaceae bacterium]|nr:type II secretion system F family protein [Elusimicrobiaceae bacterium]
MTAKTGLFRRAILECGLVLFLVGVFVPAAAANALLPQEMAQVQCANQKMRLFYFYLDKERPADVTNAVINCGAERDKDKKDNVAIAYPKWLEEDVNSMSQNMVWRDPSEGDLSEAALWQTTISLLYSFFDLTRKTFPRDVGGDGIPPNKLIKEYSDIRLRYQLSLDRVYRARLYDSFNGRGRALLSSLDLMAKEMESVADSLSSQDVERYAQAVVAISVMSQTAFGQLFTEPRQVIDEKKEASKSSGMAALLYKLAGMLLVFIAVVVMIVNRRGAMDEYIADYIVKSKKWTEDFNRQFMQVKVEYMVLAPVAIGMILGLLTFNFLVFIMLTLFGAYLGLRMPATILTHMKERRGHRVDAQLMDALILLSNSLKSGLDIVQGFELVAKDLQPPISDEFGLVIKNYQLGTAFEQALFGMQERVASRMLAYMIKAVVLQRQVGGNLTKIFSRIVDNIREESKLEEKVQSLTAQQKIQSIVVGLMPWIILLMMFVFQPKVMIKFYSSPVGVGVLIFSALWIGIGMKVVAKMGVVKV